MPQSAPISLPGQLPTEILASSDAQARFFVEWWQRMHQKPNPLAAVELKCVTWANEGEATQRYVWEVCRWPQGPKGRSSEWAFVCWMIDGVGMWMKRFSSKRAALAYLRESPSLVMARPTEPHPEPPSGDDVLEGAH